jgi:ectoine hydroxylase-related dioxygenase (phytanoyl-CoA dioxygenase family)
VLGTDELMGAYDRDGFVIVEGALSDSELEEARATLAPYLDVGASGRNNFEGEQTKRLYSLVGRGAIFERTVEHPTVLGMCDRLLDPNYLLTASQAICLYGGETPQPVHYDDSFYPIPRPRKAVSVSTIWALDDFTADNGATEVIRGSHLFSDEQVANSYSVDPNIEDDPAFVDELETVVMPAGSAVIFAGTLLHRGGHNRSGTQRRAFSHQYCQPWARQQENYCLSVPHDRAAKMSQRVRELLGYSIMPPFMGQIAGRHPQKVLEPGYRNSLDDDDLEIKRSNGGGQESP